MSDLGHAVHFADLALVRERGQPPKLMRARTLASAAAIVESGTGVPVEYRWAKSDQPAFEFTNAEGRAVRHFMKLVDPKSSERSLVETLIDLRRAAAPA